MVVGENEMNNSITICDIKNVDQRLEVLEKNSYEYSWNNYIIHYLFHKNKVLVKIKKENIYAVIPCSTERRHFVGKFYKNNDMLCLEGKFEILPWVMIFFGTFWGLIWIIWVYIFFLIVTGEIIFIKFLFFFLVATIAMFCFHLWCFFLHRNRKYEKRIIDYITDILTN